MIKTGQKEIIGDKKDIKKGHKRTKVEHKDVNVLKLKTDRAPSSGYF